MKCEACDGTGLTPKGFDCWECNGSGTKCDVCGEACELFAERCDACQAEADAADAKTIFRGKTYMYPTPSHGLRRIGVCHGLGTTWIVAWQNDHGSRKRVKTRLLDCPNDPDELQRKLDVWASIRGLQEG